MEATSALVGIIRGSSHAANAAAADTGLRVR